eukprot:gene10318-8249_t
MRKVPNVVYLRGEPLVGVVPAKQLTTRARSALYSRAYTSKPMISVEEKEKKNTALSTDVWADRWGPPLFRGRAKMQRPLESKAN